MGVGCWRLWTLYIHAQFYACADNCRAVATLRNLAELFGIRSAVFWLWDTFQAESGTAVLVKKNSTGLSVPLTMRKDMVSPELATKQGMVLQGSI